jgi:hypothetical protein
MFLRSARNAGFDVPEQPINDAIEYVGRCFIPATGQFQYEIGARFGSRGMTGAGAVADTLLENQNTDGSWDPERDDERWGNSLTTAMVVLALGAPEEQLPIFQR